MNDGTFVEQLFIPEGDVWLPAVIKMKNYVIGNNSLKAQVMMQGVVPRLLQFMVDENMPLDLRIESAIVLGSLAKGTEENINGLIEAGTISVLLQNITHPCLKYVEACLRCLRTIFSSSLSSFESIYQDPNAIHHLINIMSKSICTQECVPIILYYCCKNADYQLILYRSGIVTAIAPLLLCEILEVQMPALKCMASICHQNEEVACAVAATAYNGEGIPRIIVKLLAQDKPTEMQMSAAKCLTHMYRAKAIESTDKIISHKTLPALVRLCRKDQSWEMRVEGAETLAYLIETDLNLQQIAAISDQLLETLSDYFRYPGCPLDVTLMPVNKDDIVVGNELRQAAFRAFASLAANDEDIRKQILQTANLMDHIVNGLSDPVTKVQLAAFRCMHSLSRSVQQLRTSFQDHTVWKPLMSTLHNATEEVLIVASSTLCNLLLEFSPSKEPMLDSGVIELLVDLTKRDDPALRVNGIWALMNMAFQAEQRTKTKILVTLGADQMFRLLSDTDLNVLMKTLGLLRNLLSGKPHIDYIMMMHGTQIMQAVILILEGDNSYQVKEQALCILANVADGDTAKDLIMTNEDVLKKLTNYMHHTNVKLQIASTVCISNLIWNDEEGALERQMRLRDLGVQKILQNLLTTKDTVLFEKVTKALQQF